ncbi:16S rRNA (guanine(527)-N(7))-methyltransferase RsmG [Methylophilaceae bacterium]|nr:16S rRNA (guanine(527)-N(7))-methyltransferase RsmG [Methylophilaceae bacterium]
MHNKELLVSGLETLGIQNQNSLVDKLLFYMDLLRKWNKTYNLTAIREEQDIITHHLLDCLSVTKLVNAKNIMDVGSGAGLPGLIFALCFPDRNITMVDKVGKKTAFIQQVIGEFNLNNAMALKGRVEDIKNHKHYDGIISRAFSDMETMIKLTSHLLIDGGNWYGMKSKNSRNGEMTTIKYSYHVDKIDVPHLKAERYLITVVNAATNKFYR